MRAICTILSLLCGLEQVRTSNILFYWSVSGYSHRISAWPIIEKLVESGHKITFISPYPSKIPKSHPNITDIVPKNLAEDLGLMDLDFISIRLKEGVKGTDRLWSLYYENGIKGCESLMANPEVLSWIEESTFDLVILDALYNECGYGLVHKFQAPHIMYSPTAHFPWFKDAYGLPDENLPEMELHYSIDMTFFQSVRNLLTPLYWQWKRHTHLFPILEPLLKKSLNLTNMPSFEELEKRTSLIFTNTHPSESFSRSLPPNFVEIGGIHCNDERKPLSRDIEDFITGGHDEGFILLSFGTYVALQSLPQYLQDIFFNSMRQIPNIQFLVKFHAEPPTGLPKNVKTVKWIQQQDILAHPSIRAFIGHGGLLGTQESVYHAVPMIVVPLFAEQDYQAVRAHDRETAIYLEISELTEEKLTNAILNVTNNPKYKQNSMKLSKLFRDRPWKPLDAAIWWIEYVLRNKNVQHLRPIGINKTWYERRMLHIWGFLAAIFSAILTITLCLVYLCCKNLTRQRKNKLE